MREGPEPYPGMEVVPAENSLQSSPQYFDTPTYPIVVELDSPAAVRQQQGPNSPSANDSTLEPSEYHGVPTMQTAFHETLYNEKTPAWQLAEKNASSRRILSGKRKMWMWIALAAVVVIAAIVGGVAGSILTKRSEHHKQPEGGTSSGDHTGSSSPSATATGAIMSGTATPMSTYQFPTAVSWGYPRLEVFALHQDLYPVWKSKNSTDVTAWNPTVDEFTSLGGTTAPFQLGVAATARDGTDVDIFVAGTDKALWHKSHAADFEWSPGAQDWESLDGGLISDPTASTWAPDRLDIWAIGSDYGLWQIFWDGTAWSGWIGIGPGNIWTKDAPTVISWGLNRYDIFLVNSTDRALYHKYFDGIGWHPDGWENLGGYCTSRPVAVTRQQGFIDVVVRGGDAGLWHLSFNQYSLNQTWSAWTSLSGGAQIQAEPEAVSWGTNNLEVFAWGANNTLLHKRYDDGAKAWTPQVGLEILGANLTGPPKAISDREEGVHAFAYLDGGQLGHKTWDKDADAWEPAEGFELLGVF